LLLLLLILLSYLHYLSTQGFVYYFYVRQV